MNRSVVYLCALFFLFLFSSYDSLIKEKGISNFKLKSATTNKWISISDYKKSKPILKHKNQSNESLLPFWHVLLHRNIAAQCFR